MSKLTQLAVHSHARTMGYVHPLGEMVIFAIARTVVTMAPIVNTQLGSIGSLASSNCYQKTFTHFLWAFQDLDVY
ncbi:Hypothetical predicted protein [Octopus vulgaris]|uniref:Uncharacterized protein n=1 Tax=Octopus vulgaris TaxID=6645 RepID=A0AA36BW89_OCTVU|nr:Hypothetical predicted protein [Octopus vulgaris]